MRKDMSKVIVERPRLGRSRAGLRPGRSAALVDDDGEPIRAQRPARAPKKDRPDRTKALNENLAPLRRFIGRQVGRPWDKVYSEIAENLKVTSTVQQHVRDHLEDFVALGGRMKNGEVLLPGRFGGDRTLVQDYRRFYVHPRTGLLKENPHYRKYSATYRAKQLAAEKERAARMRVIDAKTQLHKLKDGIWWEVKLGKIGDGREADVVLAAGLSSLDAHTLYGRENARAIAKRQLNKAEKKKHGLD